MKKTACKKRKTIGGMALFNGLMLRDKNKEVVSILENEEINVHINKMDISPNRINKFPLVRGIISLVNTISSSVPYIMSSVKDYLHSLAIAKKDGNIEKNITIDKFEIICGFVIAIVMLLSAFTLIPNLISTFFPWHIQNIIQAAIQVAIIIVYLLTMAKTNILKELFEYHGAEHKVVNAYEKLKFEDITVENVKKQSRFHIRCGGNFVVYLFILVILATLLIPPYNIIQKSIIQTLLFPFFVGIAYEFVIYSDRLPGILKYLAYPAMLIQYVTTKEPSNEKIEVAIFALFACVGDTKSKTAKQFIDDYIKKELINTKYDLDDILRIISYAKGINKDKLYVDLDSYLLTYNDQIKIERMLNKVYIEFKPLQYVLGRQSFYDEEYFVNENVLIPRQDSEILVQKAIQYIEKYEIETMIDMCTGSGCLGISISKNSDIKTCFLVDVSRDALTVSLKNIKINGLDHLSDDKKVLCVNSDLFEVFLNKKPKYDLVVSNPPYIKTGDIDKLSAEVKNEPHLALDGGKTGIEVYKMFFEQVRHVLKQDGFVIVEIGFDQLEDIKRIIKGYREFEIVETVKDYGGNDRVVICRLHQI